MVVFTRDPALAGRRGKLKFQIAMSSRVRSSVSSLESRGNDGNQAKDKFN